MKTPLPPFSRFASLAGLSLLTACTGVETDDALGDDLGVAFRDCAAVLEQTVVAAGSGELCPNDGGPVRPGMGIREGDREFGGNGPDIDIEVQAEISPDGRHVVAHISYVAQEVGGDSRIEQEWTRPLYTAPEGMEILSIDSDTSSTITSRSPSAGWEAGFCNDGDPIPQDRISIAGGLVSRVDMIGDTGNGDISSDDNCSCDTRVDNITFADLELTMIRTGDEECPEDNPDADIADGIETGTRLQLPAYDPTSASTIVEGGTTYMQILPPSNDWDSFRVYDSGACSLNVPWLDPLPFVPFPGLPRSFAEALVGELDRQFAVCGDPGTTLLRTEPLTITPVFRSEPGERLDAFTVDADEIRLHTRYRAGSLGICSPVNLDVDIAFTIGMDDDGNFVATLTENNAEVVGLCLGDSLIEGTVEDLIRDNFESAVVDTLNEQLDQSPGLLGLPSVACSSDDDCVGAYPGTGHSCNTDAGECLFRINAERVNVRPEGLEVVLIEDENSPQFPLYNGINDVFSAFICGEDRLGGVIITDSPIQSSLEPFEVPASGTEPC